MCVVSVSRYVIAFCCVSRYTAESNDTAAVTIDQWQLHFKNVMSSPKFIMEKKLDLLMRGGFPQKCPPGFLSEKRLRFIGEVVRMVGVS